MQTYKCYTCGKPVKMYRSYRKKIKRVFCSEKCRKTPSVPIRCVVCGCIFLAKAQTSGRAKYCSRKCELKYYRDNEIHKSGKLTKSTCEECGKEYSVRPSVAKVQKYCSQSCSGKALGRKRTGKNNHKWKPKVDIVCDYCGKSFKTYPSRKERKKYCCKRHRIFGNFKRLASGKRTKIEKTMAKALRKANITFEEQVVMFDKFMVDFLVNNHKIVVQCDGVYWHDRPKVKARDKGQDRYLEKAGYTVLRFTDEQINSDINSCVNTIKSHLG